MRHIFIINPHAGKKDQTGRIYEMADLLRAQHGLECQCLLTQRPGGAEEMARRLVVSLLFCSGLPDKFATNRFFPKHTRYFFHRERS